jgi:hypothetical protein
MMARTYHPSHTGSTNRKIMVQACGVKLDPISKITKAKRAGNVVQVVEHLLNKQETLVSTPSMQN